MSSEVNLLALVLVIAPLVVLWVLAIFSILVRRPDLSVALKAAWMAIVVLVPYLGVLLYAGLHPPRSTYNSNNGDDASAGAILRLSALVDAHNGGTIDDAEFTTEKAAVFGLGTTTA